MNTGAARLESIAEAALRGRIGVPDELRRYLRSLEARLRQTLEMVEAVPPGDPDVDAVREEMEAALHDQRRSPLHRALRRRTEHLRQGAAARGSLEQCMDGLLGRANHAVERVHTRAELRTLLDRLDSRFGALLPWHLGHGLERMRLTPATVARMYDEASLKAAVGRAKNLEGELAKRTAALPGSLDEPREVSDWPEGVSHGELAAAVMASDRAARGDRGLEWRSQGRMQASRHLVRLIGAGDGSSAPADRVEAAAAESMRLVEAGLGTGAEDLDAQLISVRGAVRRRVAAWSRAGTDEPVAGEPADSTGALQFVVPLFGDFVLIRRGEPWPVRVDETGVRCGKPVRCSAVLAPGAASTPLSPDVWAPLFFDVPAGAEGEWLLTAEPATVLPFARIADDRWLGRVTGRGKLRPIAHSRWSGERPQRGKVIRTLTPASEVGGEDVIAVGPVLRREEGPFGWRTLTVHLPLADVRQGWLRTAETSAGRDHVEAEQAFFQAAGRLIPGSTPRCLGRCEKPHGYVYAPPLALSPESSLALRSWREEDPVAFVAAAARLWRRFTDAGLALGFYHDATLAFRVHPGEPGSRGVLEAVAVAAPLGTRLGAAYRRSMEVSALFPGSGADARLRVGSAQLVGETALPVTEARAALQYAAAMLNCDAARTPIDAVERATRLLEIVEHGLSALDSEVKLLQMLDRIATL